LLLLLLIGLVSFNYIFILSRNIYLAEVAIPHMAIDRDIRLSGFASYVGKSSMEVTLNIDQVDIQFQSIVYYYYI
jgi:hypothetical protein